MIDSLIIAIKTVYVHWNKNGRKNIKASCQLLIIVGVGKRQFPVCIFIIIYLRKTQTISERNGHAGIVYTRPTDLFIIPPLMDSCGSTTSSPVPKINFDAILFFLTGGEGDVFYVYFFLEIVFYIKIWKQLFSGW